MGDIMPPFDFDPDTPGYYVLGGSDGKTPIRVRDVVDWGRWMELRDRHVARDLVGPILVSTVFLGVDHSIVFQEDRGPVVFETMIFSDQKEMDEMFCRRYRTWAEAERGHKVALRYAKSLWKRSQLMEGFGNGTHTD
jgi:hypothetical protein